MSKPARVYMVLMVLSGMGTLLFALVRWQPRNLVLFGMYLVLAVVASSLRIVLPWSSFDVPAHYLLMLIGTMVLDLSQNLMVAVICTAAQCLGRPSPRASPVQFVFNIAGSIVASSVSYYTYHAFWTAHPGSGFVLPLVSAATVYFLANTLSVAGILSLTGQQPFWVLWREKFLSLAPQYLMGVALAGLIRLYVERVGWSWSLLVTPAIFLIYSSYRLYLERIEGHKRHISQIADLHLRTIEALAVAIEAKDAATHAHLRRVQVYAVEIARELGAPLPEVEALRAAALLHDIGKLAVPEYILSKPGQLSPEEFEKIKIHPEIGAEILRHVPFPYPVAPIVAAHHEKWDGSGYPYGLRGREIPLGARILSAVDCLDALATDRQYRRALPLGEAMQFVISQSGISFDPDVVDVLKRRYLELEALARNAVPPGHNIPNMCRQSAASPQAGFEEPCRSADRPGFTYAIAAAREEFQMLHEVTSELGTSLSMDGTMSLLGTKLKSIVPYDAIAIYVCKGGKLVPEYVHGKDVQQFRSLEIPFGQGLSGWVAENRKPIVNGNPSVEPGYDLQPAALSGLNSAISVPLVGVGGVVGVLTLYHSGHHAFTRDHLRLLLAISSKAALTIENALRYREAQKSATTDELTGLPNARSLFVHLDSELARCTRANTSLAVLVLDLDGFKMVNDRFGHLAGNRVLKLVAHGLRSFCREYDYVARMGGDEFVLIIPGMKDGAVGRKTQDLSAMVREAGREVTGEDIVALSLGDAFFPRDGSDTEELLAEADRRMYQVKRSHRTGDTREASLGRLREIPVQTTAVQ